MEGEGHFQLRQTVGDVDHAADYGKEQRDDGQRHAAVAHQQQGDHNERVEYLLAHRHDLLEQVLLVDGHMAFKDADGERQRGVHRQNTQKPLGEVDLLRRQLFAEHHVTVGQDEADRQHRRTQQEIRNEEHTVELGAALFVTGGAEAGVVAHVGTAKPEAQQIQIGDNGQYRLVHAKFAVAQLPEHDGGIDQRDYGAQCHGDIAQRGAGTHLIHLQQSAPSQVNSIALYYSPKAAGCKVSAGKKWFLFFPASGTMDAAREVCPWQTKS